MLYLAFFFVVALFFFYLSWRHYIKKVVVHFVAESGDTWWTKRKEIKLHKINLKHHLEIKGDQQSYWSAWRENRAIIFFWAILGVGVLVIAVI
ncbi:MAG: hypothetical protein COV55_00735 [Candidatus Komeilibacteria bacterium CG11_big_fil_rev_8_21_14_0_20_36_20]|uniref:Uncharacterized protein n=1 Tax=Candidatus Komeilibacteria bacterium CG11_big_fil_rev_8_21_14_0_20_36_20 TaxID=1974477 RepID=A0A2H0NDI0_9BACT|nr:MAG: hypothetical protein COV55_00735 [Candidatus Komeilibacteria bacterium CG11_big_fil_rev_8_21_14_0_20_36_20]PIR81308.1 MAG: hypothetical protein COU21_03705 [Candidatus Komeilibacteria bacterium CG10_big_fil_rev_8_21_14_0_10_36_65]PJC54938.1 MAG: hypothetical protein CO027_04375 [Candidatus Komeilibacteria bacterium CG_4_9_14_0_2_um_filter_36_13]